MNIIQKGKIMVDSILFKGSHKYWIDIYKKGGNSGESSFGKYAAEKAGFVNRFLKNTPGIKTISEMGCGDGNQLKQYSFGARQYYGYDISGVCIEKCEAEFKNSRNMHFFEIKNNDMIRRSDALFSIDVTFHLIEDDIYLDYLETLFGKAQKYVLLMSTDHTNNKFEPPHVKHRNITKDIKERFKRWKLIRKIRSKEVFKTYDEKLYYMIFESRRK